jgi:hypothetical protein
MRYYLMPIALILGFSLMAGCDLNKKIEGDGNYDDSSTWKSVYTRILEPKCAGCHKAGTAFAEQSGLILTSDVAYKELVGGTVKNLAAQKDGLEMLGNQGLQSLYKSYLWEKINYPNEEHFINDHPYYGALMPFGSDPLTNGELKLIRTWIEAGSPEIGKVADLKLLDDKTKYERPAFKALEKPANGLQIHLEPFTVAPNYEREFNQYTTLKNTSEMYINQYQIEMRANSHHFILYNFNSKIPASMKPQEGVKRDIRDASGNYILENLLPMQYHVFFAGTQWPRLNYKFPEGVGLKIPVNAGYDMNSHYVNRTSQAIDGEVYVNLYSVDKAAVKYEAQVLDINNTSFTLPPKKTTTIEKSFTASRRMNIFQLFSHAHKLMTEFKVQVVGGANDGKIIYVAYDWEHPPILSFDTPFVLEAGQGLKLIATYNNTTDQTVGFGLRAEDEMMILFGYYY